jgi:hypothetical protein
LLVKTSSVGYAAHDAKQMIVVVNASSRDVPRVMTARAGG